MARPNPWVLKDFAGGYLDGIDDSLMPENASPDCLNVISPIRGILEKRRGQESASSIIHATHPINGLYAYYYGIPVITRRLLMAAGGSAGYMDGANFVSLKTGLTTSEPILFETCANYVVSFSGVDQPWKWNGTSVSDLLNAPVDGRFPTLFKEKLFVVPITDPSLLRWSESLQPEEWPGVYYWPVNDGDGDRITALTRHLDELVIFKNRSIWTLRGNWIEDFVLSDVTRKVGAVGHRAITQEGLFLYFVSSQGLYMYDGMQVYNLSEQSIPKLWERVNQSALYKAAVTSWRGAIWFSLPIDNSTINNLLLAFVPTERGQGSWWPWSGINASCFEVFDDGTSVNLYSGDATKGQIRKQDIGNEDLEQEYSAYWVSKTFDMGLPEHEKKAKRMYLERSPYTDNYPGLEVALDYGEYNSLRYDRGDGMVDQYRFTNRSRWRYLSAKIIPDDEGPCQVRGIYLPYKIKRRPKVRVVAAEEGGEE